MRDEPVQKRFSYPAIGCLGFIGALCRYGLDCVVPTGPFPLSTLLINILGCFLIEITYLYLGRRLHLSTPVVRAMGIGFLGAFSTMSAFCNQTIVLLHDGATTTACFYVMATFICCFLATAAGRRASRALAQTRLARLRSHRRRNHDDSEGRR